MRIFYWILICINITVFSQERLTKAVKLNGKIIIDGFEDSEWIQGEWEKNFTQFEPEPFVKPAKKTEFKIRYDESNIYFFIKIYDDKSDFVTQSGKKDHPNFWETDYIAIYIDPLNDNSTGYLFGLNPSNMQYDMKIFDDNRYDQRWDAVWYSEVGEFEDGWTAEVKIPLHTIRFQDRSEQVWGLNVERKIKRLNEISTWQKVDPDIGFKVSEYGKIIGLTGLKTANKINVIPSLVAIADSKRNYQVFNGNRHIGLDLRYNFDAQHSILATFRPDFSQIESDEDQINITDYPIYFPEKRPFFLEADDLYRVPDPLYYSRNMARPNFGVKFYGNSSDFKYGLTAVNNDGRVFNSEGKEKSNNENFVIFRTKFERSEKLMIGYLWGLKKSDKTMTGQLHTFDFRYRPTKQIMFLGYSATTLVDANTKQNLNYRIRASYTDDNYELIANLRSRSLHFRQSLIGAPVLTNNSRSFLYFKRKWRVNKNSIQNYSLRLNINSTRTYSNSVKKDFYNLGGTINFQFESIGKLVSDINLYTGRGYVRQYFDPKDGRIYTISDSKRFDNYGYFLPVNTDNEGIHVKVSTDFSKRFAGSIEYYVDDEKQSRINYLVSKYQYKANEDFKLIFTYNTVDVRGSYYLQKKFLQNMSMKIEYTILGNLYSKYFLQYNEQSRELSNNFVLTYEYKKGSFVYFALNELGSMLNDDEYNRGPIINNYKLNRRTVSLKWTYSFFI